MKKRIGRRVLGILILAMVGMILFSVSASAAVSLNKKNLRLCIGTTESLKLYGVTKQPTWKTCNSRIAKVTATGRVIPVRKGKCRITAQIGRTKYTCKVKVVVPVKEISLNKSVIGLKKKKKYKLESKVFPSNASNKAVSYRTSNPKVAVVSSKGIVKAVGYGTAVIAVKAKDGSGTEQKCLVRVNKLGSSSSMSEQFFRTVERYARKINADIKEGRSWTYGYGESITKSRSTTCVYYIIWALREIGVLGKHDTFEGGQGNIRFYRNSRDCFRKYANIIPCRKSTKELVKNGVLRPGDICIYNMHSNVYAGNGTWYDAGRIRLNGKYIGNTYYFNTIGPMDTQFTEDYLVNYIIRLK